MPFGSETDTCCNLPSCHRLPSLSRLHLQQHSLPPEEEPRSQQRWTISSRSARPPHRCCPRHDQGPLANITIGQEIPEHRHQTLWSLYSATKRDDNTPCTVLAFDLTQPHNASRANLLPLAKNAARKLRTTRHPDVVKLIDSVETNQSVYIAVEKVTPLYKVLAQSEDKRATPQRQDWIVWGLSSIVSAVKFLNVEAASTHGNLRPESIFISASGEWKLGGFEILTPHAEAPHGLLFSQGSLIPDGNRYAPPEVKRNGWNILASMDSTLFDSYSLALVTIEAFNGPLPPQTGTAAPPRGHVPPALYGVLQRMLVSNAKTRTTVAKIWEAGEAEGGFFKENTLVKVSRGLDGFLLATENEKASIIQLLQDKPDSFTPDFLMYKVSQPSPLLSLPSHPPAPSPRQAFNPPSCSRSSCVSVNPCPRTNGTPPWYHLSSKPLPPPIAPPHGPTREPLALRRPHGQPRRHRQALAQPHHGFQRFRPRHPRGDAQSHPPARTQAVGSYPQQRPAARARADPGRSRSGHPYQHDDSAGRLVPHLSLSTRKKVLIPAFSRVSRISLCTHAWRG